MRERPPQVCTRTTVWGNTLDECQRAAEEQMRVFFGKRAFEIIEIRAKPAAQLIGGKVLSWEAEVEGAEVWG